MRTVYCIEKGQYSDWDIESVFIEKADAERALGILANNGITSYGITERKMLEPGDSLDPVPMFRVAVDVHPNGESEMFEDESWIGFPFVSSWEGEISDRPKVSVLTITPPAHRGVPPFKRVRVWGPDESGVRKALSDALARLSVGDDV